MKKLIVLLLLSLLILSDKFTGISEWGEKSFRKLMEEKWARAVFDLEEEEAIAVFGEESEEFFL